MQSDQVWKIVPLIPRTKSRFETVLQLQRRLSFRSPFSCEPFSPVASSPKSTGSGDVEKNIVDGQEDTKIRVKAAWWMLLPVDIIKIAGLVLVIPTLTNIKKRFFNGDTKKAAFVQSTMESARAVFTICVTVQLGQLSDALGRKPLVFLSVFCTAVPIVVLTFSGNLWYYFVTFALAGALGGQSSPASQAYVADCCPPNMRARIFGLQGAIMSASFVILPGLGSLIESHYKLGTLYMTAVVLEAIAIVFVCFLPESLPKDSRKPFIAKDGIGALVMNLTQLLSRRGTVLWDLAVIRFLKGMAAGVPMLFAMSSLLHFSDADFSLLLSISGVCGMFVQSFLLKVMVRHGCSDLTLVMFSLVIDAIFHSGNCLLGRFPIKALAFALQTFDSLSAVYSPAMNSLVTKGHDDLGFVLGVMSAVDEITAFFSPWLMGGTYQLSYCAPFVVAAALNLACVVLTVRLRLRMAEEPEE